jgi:hypothetical protein|tara:strand:- start:565 stop:834 length:270 start_codon:yes stop_codon:yes gene_type:complete
MALDATNLTPLSTGNGFTLWHYTTTDAVATVRAANYFLAEVARMNKGDLIICNSSMGGTMVVSLNQVLTQSATAIDVADGTVLANTDSD